MKKVDMRGLQGRAKALPLARKTKVVVKSVVVPAGASLDLTGNVQFLGAVPTTMTGPNNAPIRAFEVIFCSRVITAKGE